MWLPKISSVYQKGALIFWTLILMMMSRFSPTSVVLYQCSFSKKHFKIYFCRFSNALYSWSPWKSAALPTSKVKVTQSGKCFLVGVGSSYPLPFLFDGHLSDSRASWGHEHSSIGKYPWMQSTRSLRWKFRCSGPTDHCNLGWPCIQAYTNLKETSNRADSPTRTGARFLRPK